MREINKESVRVLFKKFRRRFFRFFHIPLYSKEQDQLFSQAKPGDVFYCKMPVSEEKWVTIKEGHRTRPYVVVGKTKDELICYMGTTHPSKKLAYYEKLPYQRKEYHSPKTAVFALKRAYRISREHLLYPMQSLCIEDQKELNRLVSLCKKYKHRRLPSLNVPLIFRRGDIVSKDDQLYYIHALKGDCIFAYSVYHEKLHQKCVHVTYGKKDAFVDMTESIELDDLDISSLTGYCSYEDKKVISLLKQMYQKNMKKIKKEYFFDYPLGQVFIDQFNEAEFLYLYSAKHRHYGMLVEDMYEDDIPIYRMDKYTTRKSEPLDLEDVLYCVERLMENENYPICLDKIYAMALKQLKLNEE